MLSIETFETRQLGEGANADLVTSTDCLNVATKMMERDWRLGRCGFTVSFAVEEILLLLLLYTSCSPP